MCFCKKKKHLNADLLHANHHGCFSCEHLTPARLAPFGRSVHAAAAPSSRDCPASMSALFWMELFPLFYTPSNDTPLTNRPGQNEKVNGRRRLGDRRSSQSKSRRSLSSTTTHLPLLPRWPTLPPRATRTSTARTLRLSLRRSSGRGFMKPSTGRSIASRSRVRHSRVLSRPGPETAPGLTSFSLTYLSTDSIRFLFLVPFPQPKA